MDKETSELINILCYKLPGDVSRIVYNEYEGRWNEIQHIWQYPQNRFKFLAEYHASIRHLLALSTFYRRVLSGMDGACDFYKTISKGTTRESAIDIGGYRLDKGEYNKMLAIRITFRQLMQKFGIEDHFFEYSETDGFLERCKELYLSHVSTTPRTPDTKPEDLPF